jgi:hypothetical protein
MEKLPHEMNDNEHKDARPFDLLNSENYTTQEIRDSRYDICLGCDRLFKPARACKECNCFMSLKTWIKFASCPLGKWHSVMDVETTS